MSDDLTQAREYSFGLADEHLLIEGRKPETTLCNGVSCRITNHPNAIMPFPYRMNQLIPPTIFSPWLSAEYANT